MTDNNPAQTPSQSSSELAQTNTLLALDRTLLAWIRTSLSFNAFGFTLARFIHDLVVHGTLHNMKATFPRNLGVTLMILGIAGLFCGAFDYWRTLRRLRNTINHPPWSTSMVLALALALICIFLLVDMLANLGSI